jgi:hypothetical protein
MIESVNKYHVVINETNKNSLFNSFDLYSVSVVFSSKLVSS